MDFPPKIALSRLVGSLKGVSSRRLRREFPDLVRHYRRAQRLWFGSHFAGPVGGAPLSIVKQYEALRGSTSSSRTGRPAPDRGEHRGSVPITEARAAL
ncbi:IS200/IS605 family transposase [Streptomyces antibioticus]|uniref:IS200/IS605 family transposase n=1 Tax=Streptomyces antibioticus TaxID=1890 RepID=UPI003F4B6EF6